MCMKKCKHCESENMIYLSRHKEEGFSVKEYLCLNCMKMQFVKGIHVNSCEKIENGDIDYICGCMGQNNHTIYNNDGKVIELKF